MSLMVQGNPVRSNIAGYSKNARETTGASSNLKNIVKTEGTSQTKKSTSEEEMAIFKKEFYQDLENIQLHSTVKNAAVNISDKAFEKMKDDPQYRNKVLSLLQRDLCSSYAPRDTSVLLTVGESLEQYRGDSWPTCNDSEFWGRSQNCFYKKTNNKDNDDHKKRIEEHLKLLREQQYYKQNYQPLALNKAREERKSLLKAAQVYAYMQDLHISR